MPTDINRVTLVGRLTRDPELRFTQSSTPIASFSIANNRTYMVNNEKREQVSYFNCVLWGKAGEVFVKYAKKGNRVGIDGHLQQRSWEDKEGAKKSTVEVVVENFQFLSDNRQTGQQDVSFGSEDERPVPNSPSQAGDFGREIDSINISSDDDIPF